MEESRNFSVTNGESGSDNRVIIRRNCFYPDSGENPHRSNQFTPNPQSERLLTLGDGVAIDLIPIHSKLYSIGSSQTDLDRWPDEIPAKTESSEHQFSLGRTPVTVAQFMAFTKSTGYITMAERAKQSLTRIGSSWRMVNDTSWLYPYGRVMGSAKNKLHHPVTHITLKDVFVFCDWASKVSKRSVRPPSEYEWERAAGEDNDTDFLDANVNYQLGDTRPVGFSTDRCSDMRGNVFEWTFSQYSDANSNPPPNEPSIVIKGGAFCFDKGFSRRAFRGKVSSQFSSAWLGFRILVEV